MKILHTVEFYYPSVGGMQEVVKQLSERLVICGHDVTVATSRIKERNKKIINGVKIIEFDIAGNLVRGLTGNIKDYEDYLLNSNFDVITNFAAQQWATDIALPLLHRIRAVKVFVPTGFSGFYMPQYQQYFNNMQSWIHQYDMNIFLSHNYRDINFAKQNGVKNTVLIPNGAAADEFLTENPVDIRKLLEIPDRHFLILDVGSHTGVKGHEEAIEIFSRANIKNATFLLIGNDPGGCTNSCIKRGHEMNGCPSYRRSDKKLIIANLSREETVAAYKSAELFLFTSNIECSPIVLFECMASRTPFLTTDVGNSAEIIEWSKSGILLPTSKSEHLTERVPCLGWNLFRYMREWIAVIVSRRRSATQEATFSRAIIKESVSILERFINAPDKRLQMAEAGFKAWQSRFTWEKIARDYEGLYENLLREKN